MFRSIMLTNMVKPGTGKIFWLYKEIYERAPVFGTVDSGLTLVSLVLTRTNVVQDHQFCPGDVRDSSRNKTTRGSWSPGRLFSRTRSVSEAHGCGMNVPKELP